MRDTGLLAARKGCHSDAGLILKFSVLCLVLCLSGLSIACGSASQSALANNQTGSSGQLRVSPPPPQAIVGVTYNAVSTVSGGSAPYSFRITSGSLPPGLSLNPATGSITGTPSVSGSYDFTLYVSALGTPSHDRMSPDGASASGNIYGSSPASIVVSAKRSGSGLAISPGSLTLQSLAQQQFTATMSGSADTAVTWSASAGTISSAGAFTAPLVTKNTSVTLTATSVADPKAQAAAAVTVIAPTSLGIVTSGIPNADAGIPYTAALAANGGSTPYQWSLAGGSLPTGIQLQAGSGVITGLTALTGSYPFTAKVTDSSGHSATLGLTLTVSSSSANGFDGPAELPRIYIQTAMSNTPAPGKTTAVNSGGDLQSALNSANCGDTIQLQSGATFTGVFTFPAKSCDDGHWIIVRTNSADSLLPAEGSRLTPCYAGVSSLPGRPALNCASTKNVLAKLVTAGTGSGPIIFASGANHYRLIGLEVTRVAGTGVVYALASVAIGGTASNLILDRMWLHGTSQDETNKGIELGGSSYVSAIDSFFTDFHCVSVTGACTDALAVGGGEGNPVGPYKVTGNFLEASGENILFGGAQSTTTPADIEISHNHFFKPMMWMKGQPGYVGGTNGNPFIVKNLLELKNAQRVLVEANIMEYSWGGFSQDGFALLITPKNQAASTGTGNLCPICQVTDVTVRYNTMSHLGAGLQIANVLSDNSGVALDGQRYSIHDITIDDIDKVKYAGTGRVAEVMTQAPSPLLQNVSLNHITAFGPSGLFSVGGELNPQMANVTLTNSIYLAGIYPVWSTGGGITNCAYYDKPITTFNACFGANSFLSNAIIATPSGFPVSSWPSGNFFPATASAVQFVNYNNGIGGNYQLLISSPYHNAGSDGKDLGADVGTIVSETTGVY